jgi:hypothetical protein
MLSKPSGRSDGGGLTVNAGVRAGGKPSEGGGAVNGKIDGPRKTSLRIPRATPRSESTATAAAASQARIVGADERRFRRRARP